MRPFLILALALVSNSAFADSIAILGGHGHGRVAVINGTRNGPGEEIFDVLVKSGVKVSANSHTKIYRLKSDLATAHETSGITTSYSISMTEKGSKFAMVDATDGSGKVLVITGKLAKDLLKAMMSAGFIGSHSMSLAGSAIGKYTNCIGKRAGSSVVYQCTIKKN